MNREDYLRAFLITFGKPVDLDINDPANSGYLGLCLRLIREEYQEVIAEAAIAKIDTPKLLKELADLQYVLSQFAAMFNLPLEEAFVEVHKSNLSKRDDDGKPILREDGKILKSKNYVEPDMEELING